MLPPGVQWALRMVIFPFACKKNFCFFAKLSLTVIITWWYPLSPLNSPHNDNTVKPATPRRQKKAVKLRNGRAFVSAWIHKDLLKALDRMADERHRSNRSEALEKSLEESVTLRNYTPRCSQTSEDTKQQLTA
jgi:hypothetical protein